MMLPSIDLLVTSVQDPTVLTGLNESEWDLLIRQARAADLLGRIATKCNKDGVLDRIPGQPRMHIASAAKMAERQQKELRWEVEQIRDALVPVGLPVVLLKGAAYAMAGLDAAEGRMVSDLDILVPHDALLTAESALMKKGWISSAKSAYDQRYYRTWMHELPPMRHIKRGTVIDVHHAILPTTSRLHPSSARLLAGARPVGGDGGVKVLSSADMVLHSASHLFHEGEFHHGLRDLCDIDSLLREFGSGERFWSGLVPRAHELELIRPLQYALRYASILLGTPIPEGVQRDVMASPEGRKPGIFLSYMDVLFLRALRPHHATASDGFTSMAHWQLYLRGHWLRMPPWLLLRHLLHKAFIRPKLA